MVLDFPNAFIHTNITPNKDSEKMVIMKITDVKVDMLLELNSEMYSRHVLFENIKKLIYVVVLREIYGMLVVFILLYKKFCGDLENIGF